MLESDSTRTSLQYCKVLQLLVVSLFAEPSTSHLAALERGCCSRVFMRCADEGGQARSYPLRRLRNFAPRGTRTCAPCCYAVL